MERKSRTGSGNKYHNNHGDTKRFVKNYSKPDIKSRSEEFNKRKKYFDFEMNQWDHEK